MKTILVDDETKVIQSLEHIIAGIGYIEVVKTFSGSEEAAEYLRCFSVDLVIMDMKMNGGEGVSLCRRFREIRPELQFIFITQQPSYDTELLQLGAAGYLRKECKQEELRYAVESARLLSKRRKKRIYVKTFGHFDVFVDGKPIRFHSSKAKELLALLVDRQGGTVNTDQAIGALWEDRPNDGSTQNLCSKVVRGLAKELEAYRAGEMLVNSRGVRWVDTEVFACDLYEFFDGNEEVRKQYNGEYMLDYSWAEDRLALLEKYVEY